MNENEVKKDEMSYEEAIKVINALWAYKAPQYTENEIREALDLAIQALTYKAKIKKYGSELAMAYAEKAESDAYLKELNERHKKVFGKTLDDLMSKGGVE